MKPQNNINPINFADLLQKIILSTRGLMELTRERELPPIVNGVMVYIDENDKCGFQIARQYQRPTEYLQAFLDIIRVEFDPHPLGTFQLNSNLGFIFDSIPKNELQLGYVSISSEENQAFHDFWHNDALNYLAECGYDIHQIATLFAVVTAGEERHGLELMWEVQDTLMAGFTIDEVLGNFAEAVATDRDVSLKASNNTYAGFCCDPALGNKLRLSLWFFIKNEGNGYLQ